MAGNPVATFAAPTVIADAATQVIDCSSASQFSWTLGANRTVSAFLSPAGGQIISMEVTQDATGSRLLTWPANVSWPTNGTAPTLTVTATNKPPAISSAESVSPAAPATGQVVTFSAAAIDPEITDAAMRDTYLASDNDTRLPVPALDAYRQMNPTQGDTP